MDSGKPDLAPTTPKDPGDVPEKIVEQIESQDDPSEPAELRPEEPMQVITEDQGWLKRLLKSKKFWFRLILIIVVGGILAWLIGPSRIFIVNLLGLRAELVVTSAAQTPPGTPRPLLKNAEVKINGQTYRTDEKGTATVRQPYGAVFLELSKPGYKESTSQFFLDFDPFFYQLGGLQKDEQIRKPYIILESIGLNLQFRALDWLTGFPVAAAQFTVGDIVARPDDQGVVKITIPATDAKTASVAAKFENGAYIEKTVEIPIASENPESITYVPIGKHYFVSQSAGAYGIFRCNLDGSELEEVIPGTVNESAALQISTAPSGKYVAVISTREGVKNSRGLVQPRLYILETSTKRLTSADAADAFQIVDWVGDKVVYTSANSSGQSLAAVDGPGVRRTALASAAQIKNIYAIVDTVLFTASSPDNPNSPELKAVNVKGGSEKSLGFSVRAVSQPDPERIVYQTANNLWHEFNVNTNQARDVSPPASAARRFMNAASPNGQYRLFLDGAGGAGTLAVFVRHVATGQDRQLVTSAALRPPIGWAGNNVFMRQAGPPQSADYAVSPLGGDVKKIINVPAVMPGGEGFN